VNKFVYFEAYISSCHPDIIGVTESWTTSDIVDSEVMLNGYDMFRCDRPTDNKGGGVLLYIRSDLRPTEYITRTKFPEHVWCKIGGSKNQGLLIGVCYRSDNINIFADRNQQELVNLINEVGGQHVLILGDFNYKDIDWNSSVGPQTSNGVCQRFIDCLEDNFLTQHVLNPTRDSSILDLILTSDPELVSDVQIIEKLATSDHSMLTCRVQMDTSTEVTRRMRFDYNRADFEGFRRELSEVDWDRLLSGDTRNCWTIFKTNIQNLEKKYVPLKNVRSKRKAKAIWMTNGAVKLVTKKRKLFAKYKDSYHPAVRRADKQAIRAVKKARKQFEKKLAKNIKQDKKSFFAYMRSKCKTKTHIGKLTDSMGHCLGGVSEIVDEFNNYFSSVFTKEDTSNVPEPVTIFQGPDSERLLKIDFSVEEITKKLAKLRSDKSGGPDDMSPRLLLNIHEEIGRPLQIVFEKSMEEGIVPDDWKCANVCPIYKKGNRDSVENYRPVSLTSQVCKVFESLVRDKMVHHLERHQLLKESQHGFRRGRSCLTNLLAFLDKVTGIVDDGESVDVIFLDFAKAFDKVPHHRLLKKLTSHGIGGKLREWISQWLSGRTQRVSLNGTVSSWQEVTSGVPQGSVIGPVLFLIYINDLEDGIEQWILKFADDTKMFARINNTQDAVKMQNDLDRIVQWSHEWQMLFNVLKCKIMHIGKKNSCHSYQMNGATLESVSEERDLGVIISKDLKVSNQCAQAYSKANKMLGLINRTIQHKNEEVMINLYKALVRPHLEFCTVAWSPYYQKDKALIEKIQHRFTKMIYSLRNKSYEDRISHLGLWTLEERRNRADLIEVFKMHHGLSKLVVGTFFDKTQSDRTRGHSLKLVKHHCRTDLRQHFFSERVVSRWNRLSEDAVTATSLNVFKKKLTLLRKTRMGLFSD